MTSRDKHITGEQQMIMQPHYGDLSKTSRTMANDEEFMQS